MFEGHLNLLLLFKANKPCSFLIQRNRKINSFKKHCRNHYIAISQWFVNLVNIIFAKLYGVFILAMKLSF